MIAISKSTALTGRLVLRLLSRKKILADRMARLKSRGHRISIPTESEGTTSDNLVGNINKELRERVVMDSIEEL